MKNYEERKNGIKKPELKCKVENGEAFKSNTSKHKSKKQNQRKNVQLRKYISLNVIILKSLKFKHKLH